MSETASCGATAPFIPRWGQFLVCILNKGHAGDHSAGTMGWPQAPHAAAAPSIGHTLQVGGIQPGPEPTRAELIKWARDRTAELRSSGYSKQADRATIVADLLEADAARIADLEALVDDMLAVWRKVGNNMPILADVVLQRMANARAKSKESLLHSEGTK